MGIGFYIKLRKLKNGPGTIYGGVPSFFALGLEDDSVPAFLLVLCMDRVEPYGKPIWGTLKASFIKPSNPIMTKLHSPYASSLTVAS